MILSLYRGLTHIASPGLRHLLRKRLAKGKEDPERLGERMGQPSQPRPKGRLIWIHAASVGEAVSSLSLIESLLARDSDLHILQTTGTLTSAELMHEKLPPRTLHQFIPVDQPGWVRAFFDHWQPDMALWLESELWPNLVLETGRRRIPSFLVNARLSDSSYRRWRRFPGAAGKLLNMFDAVFAQSERDKAKFQSLGTKNVHHFGNLKFAAAELPASPDALAAFREMLASRPCWLAASTHDGEEEIVMACHKLLARRYPDLVTILVPRHPARGDRIETMLKGSGLAFARRSRGESLAPHTGIYLADTLGEMGLFCRMSGIVLVAGSLVDGIGGHNPLEPAQLASAILIGPYMANCRDLADEMLRAEAALQVRDAEDIARTVAQLLQEPAKTAGLQQRAHAFVRSQAQVTEKILDVVLPAFNHGEE